MGGFQETVQNVLDNHSDLMSHGMVTPMKGVASLDIAGVTGLSKELEVIRQCVDDACQQVKSSVIIGCVALGVLVGVGIVGAAIIDKHGSFRVWIANELCETSDNNTTTNNNNNNNNNNNDNNNNNNDNSNHINTNNDNNNNHHHITNNNNNKQ